MTQKIIKTDDFSNVATLVLPSREEHYLAVCGKDALAMDRILRNATQERKAIPLNHFVFAGCGHYENYKKNISSSDGLITWLQGDACKDGEIYSMQCFAVSGINPTPITVHGRSIGFVYEDEHARYCRLNGVSPKNLSLSRAEQTREVFKIMNTGLLQHGFCFTDTVRTWLYLDKLLNWYNEFNIVRTAFFEENGIFVKMVPASTGIGAANQYGAALICDLLAVQPKTSKVKIESVESPMQGSALNYRSSFSRAVAMEFPTHRTLLISGTASIDKDGKSVHIGNPELQIDLTMRVVEAILKSRAMDWQDLVRGIAYFKNMSDLPLFDKYCKTHDIPKFPLAVAHTDICRDDLLFEIEVDATKVSQKN
jgi:enamine deaminase RidA (YjgF/YER057c/UK114 family)